MRKIKRIAKFEGLELRRFEDIKGLLRNRPLLSKFSYFKISCGINFRGVNYITWEDKAKLYQEDEVCFTFCSHVVLA